MTFLSYVTGSVHTICQEKITRFKNYNSSYRKSGITNNRKVSGSVIRYFQPKMDFFDRTFFFFGYILINSSKNGIIKLYCSGRRARTLLFSCRCGVFKYDRHRGVWKKKLPFSIINIFVSFPQVNPELSYKFRAAAEDVV